MLEMSCRTLVTCVFTVLFMGTLVLYVLQNLSYLCLQCLVHGDTGARNVLQNLSYLCLHCLVHGDTGARNVLQNLSYLCPECLVHGDTGAICLAEP